MPAILAMAYGSLVGSSGAGEEMLLFHGLRRELRIDAGGAEEQELFDAVAPGRIDDVEFDGEIVAEEIGRIGGVGQNAADFGGGEEDVFGALGCKEMVDGGAIGEVGLAACSCYEIAVALGAEAAENRGAGEAGRARDEARGGGGHALVRKLAAGGRRELQAGPAEAAPEPRKRKRGSCAGAAGVRNP